MSIASEISRLQQAKSDLATSIENKGVTVPAATTLDGYAALVDQIQQGGGSLPYDAEVEWIGVRQGAWTELSDYVPTGLGISVDMVVTFISYPSTSNYAVWFMARTGASYLSYRLIRGTSATALLFCNANDDSHNGSASYSMSANKKYHIHLGKRSMEISTDGGSTSSFNANTTHTGTTNTNGFQIGDAGLARGTNLNVHSFTVSNYGTVMLDYIPVRVGQVGYFYDRISGKLYGKAAGCTTDLVVGADKN